MTQSPIEQIYKILGKDPNLHNMFQQCYGNDLHSIDRREFQIFLDLLPSLFKAQDKINLRDYFAEYLGPIENEIKVKIPIYNSKILAQILNQAVLDNDIEKVKTILEKDVSTNYFEDGKTAPFLYIAAIQHGNEEMVDLLLKHKADPNQIFYKSDLVHNLNENQCDLITKILKHKNTRIGDVKDLNWILDAAIRNNKTELQDMLLNKSNDRIDQSILIQLHQAIKTKNYQAVESLLATPQIDLTIKEGQYDALDQAALSGDAAIMNLVLEKYNPNALKTKTIGESMKFSYREMLTKIIPIIHVQTAEKLLLLQELDSFRPARWSRTKLLNTWQPGPSDLMSAINSKRYDVLEVLLKSSDPNDIDKCLYTIDDEALSKYKPMDHKAIKLLLTATTSSASASDHIHRMAGCLSRPWIFNIPVNSKKDILHALLEQLKEASNDTKELLRKSNIIDYIIDSRSNIHCKPAADNIMHILLENGLYPSNKNLFTTLTEVENQELQKCNAARSSLEVRKKQQEHIQDEYLNLRTLCIKNGVPKKNAQIDPKLELEIFYNSLQKNDTRVLRNLLNYDPNFASKRMDIWGNTALSMYAKKNLLSADTIAQMIDMGYRPTKTWLEYFGIKEQVLYRKKIAESFGEKVRKSYEALNTNSTQR